MSREAWTCMDCGTEAPRTMKTSGSFIGEVLIWLALVAVGMVTGVWWLLLGALAYSVWRLISKRAACSRCNSGRVVPSGTPAAEELRERLSRRDSTK